MERARRATPADLDHVAALAEAALDELEPTRGGSVWIRREARPRPARPSLAAAIDDPEQLVLVGCIDDAVVGYAAARVEPLRDGSHLAVVDDLFTDAGARGVGVGEAMMDQIVDWAVEQGCVGIDALALPGNRATKNFFETFGLVARAIVVHRPLAPGEPADS